MVINGKLKLVQYQFVRAENIFTSQKLTLFQFLKHRFLAICMKLKANFWQFGMSPKIESNLHPTFLFEIFCLTLGYENYGAFTW